MSDLDELERLAKAATPGPWEVDSAKESGEGGDWVAYGIAGVARTQWYSDSDMAHTALEPMDKPDAEFIAAANPEAVLALVARVREAESVIAEVKQLTEAILFDQDAGPARDAILAALSRYENGDSNAE